MKRTLRVHIGDAARLVGTLRYDQQGARESAVFEYDPTWLADAERFAIEPGPGAGGRPAVSSQNPRRVCFSRRDRGRRARWLGAARYSARLRKASPGSATRGEAVEPSPLNSLDYLLAVDDASRVGALRFQDENGRFQRASEDGRRTTPPLIELAYLLAASRAVETNTETAADLAYLRGRGTSLGGLRPKCSVIDDDGQLSIGKFPSVADERPVTKGEVLAMRLAKRAGIDAADARLVESDGTPIALIRRFDRPPGGGRLMYVSAATMLGAEPGDPGEHSYTELVDALRRNGATPPADIEELWRRIAFSILITNVDDHLLNHGFLHVERGLWRLSPAFDINPFPERVRELKTWVSEETGPEATIEALMSVVPYFRIARARAKTILAQVEQGVAAWRDEGRALGMTEIELESFADAFEHGERVAGRRVIG